MDCSGQKNMSETIVDVEIPFVKSAVAWLVTTPPEYSEPWTPTAEQWAKLKGKVSRCDECNAWHPLPYFTISHLKQFIGLIQDKHRVMPVAPYASFGLGPLKKFDKPW